MATLFGLPSSMFAHGLPLVDHFFLATITVFSVYTVMVLHLRSQGYTFLSCILFLSRRRASKLVCCDGCA